MSTPETALREMSYDSSFLFHSHSVLVGSLLHTNLLQPPPPVLLYIYMYVVASNTTIPLEKLFHVSYSLHMFLPTSHLL